MPRCVGADFLAIYFGDVLAQKSSTLKTPAAIETTFRQIVQVLLSSYPPCRSCFPKNCDEISRSTVIRMLKVLSRTASARRQAARKLALQEKKLKRMEVNARMMEKHQHEKVARDSVKAARNQMEEDWKLGPLAPRRDVGSAKDEYGAMEQAMTMQPSPLPVRLAWQKAMAKRQASGQGWFGNKFFVNDRAVIIRGRDKGKIGVVTDVDWQKQMVTMENMNTVRY
jgi:large subunit ribosomal protein L24